MDIFKYYIKENSHRYRLNHYFTILGELVEMRTDVITRRDYAKCAFYLVNLARRLGFDVEVYDSIREAGDGISRPNIVIKLDKGLEKTTLWVTHYDVAPAGKGWTRNPWNLTVEGGKLYGRGTSDNKGSIAAAIQALCKLKDVDLSTNINLVITADKEAGGEYGMKYLVDKVGLEADQAIILDSSPEYISIGASGLVLVELAVLGSEGHSAYPYKNVNAVYEACRLIQGLKRYEKVLRVGKKMFPAPPTSPYKYLPPRLNVIGFETKTKLNATPGEVKLTLDYRLNPSQDPEYEAEELVRSIRRIASAYAVKISQYNVLAKHKGYYVNPNTDFIRSFVYAVRNVFGAIPLAVDLDINDGRFLAEKNIPIVCFGLARSENNTHGPDEYVNLRDLEGLITLLIEVSIKRKTRNDLKHELARNQDKNSVSPVILEG